MKKKNRRYFDDGPDSFSDSFGAFLEEMRTNGSGDSSSSGGSSDSGSSDTSDRSNKEGGNGEAWTGVAGSFINNLGGILGGIGSIIGASKGTPNTVNYIEERDNSAIGKYLLIGGGLLVVVVVVIVLATRNK